MCPVRSVTYVSGRSQGFFGKSSRPVELFSPKLSPSGLEDGRFRPLFVLELMLARRTPDPPAVDSTVSSHREPERAIRHLEWVGFAAVNLNIDPAIFDGFVPPASHICKPSSDSLFACWGFSSSDKDSQSFSRKYRCSQLGGTRPLGGALTPSLALSLCAAASGTGNHCVVIAEKIIPENNSPAEIPGISFPYFRNLSEILPARRCPKKCLSTLRV